MKTNLENYEERFVDYMEGQLDASEMKEVEAFVAQHPELEEDFKLFCASKLEPNTTIIFTQKEKLMKPKTVVMPLFAKIAAIAASVALLIGLGIHFFRPNQGFVPQEMLAELKPIKATVNQEVPQLKQSNLKAVSVPKSIPEQPDYEPIESIDAFEQIATLNPIVKKSLQWDNAMVVDDIEGRMNMELEERLAAIKPFDDLEQPVETPSFNNGENVLASLQNTILDDARQTTKNLYKKTAKTIMDAYYTIDYRVGEMKDQALASR